MQVRPITLRVAKLFINFWHRHNKAPRGHKLSIGLYEGKRLVAVGTLSRPISRVLDNGINAEITRTCTDGYKNANSKVYGALLRICKAMGYHKVYTYTQAEESGASLRAVGFVQDAQLPPRKDWHQSSVALKGIRDSKSGTGGVARIRWVVVFQGNR